MKSPTIAARRSRALLTGYFFGLGTVMAMWGARMPAIQQTAHLTTGQLTVVLLAAALGMVAGLQTAGRLAHLDRLPILISVGAVSLAGCLALLGQCRSLPTLLTTALAFGMAHGVLDVAVNSAAVQCQTAYGRPIMSSLHAAYSIGALGAAALAAVTARTGHSLLFLVTGLVLAGAFLALAPTARTLSGTDQPLAPVASRQCEAPPPRLTAGRVWLLGVLAAASLLGEGAAADWAAVHLHSLDASTAVSAAAFALYSGAMAIGRLAGDRLTAGFGSTTVIRAGAVLAAAGLTTGVVTSSTPVALAGWALFGLGLSITVPSLMTAAGAGGPRALATVAVIGYLGLLAGPALIGALAVVVTLSTALLLPALLAAAVAALAPRALEKP
ncbi:MFS transporter [Streptomyces sp. NPDC001508]|uniref:MFS transporter n=1 Tax=Streptomyces sp. NPDC001508 TaxID=3154656 RepID=UPI0033284111